MQKIKKGDEVIVIAGRSKGQRGNVLKRVDESRLLVENVNMVKKHVKGNPRSGDAGGIIDQESPIQISNVMLFNPHTQKGDRVGFKTLEDDRKKTIARCVTSNLTAKSWMFRISLIKNVFFRNGQ
jgi:large subunit ribosomal protein L24